MYAVFAISALLLQPLLLVSAADAPDLSALVADRAAVERVYHNHRTGEKPAFEAAVPAALLTQMVREDLLKEMVLKTRYDVEVSAAEVSAEVERIDSTTRAPDTLAEIRAALGRDAGRFARTVARPIVVDRVLRARFDQDARVHGEQRQKLEAIRNQVLAIPMSAFEHRLTCLKSSAETKQFHEVTWLTTLRPKTVAPNFSKSATASGGRYTVQATAEFTPAPSSQVSTPAPDAPLYLEDLPPQLQQVLLSQLRRPGDVSAVIETTTAFAMYVAMPAADGQLRAGCLALPKQSFEQWLTAQQQPMNSGR